MDYEKAKEIAVRVAKAFPNLSLPFEDRVQECLLVWAELRHLPKPSNYIYVAMKNRLLDILRRENSERRALIKVDWPSDSDTPITLLMKAEQSKVVIPVPRRLRKSRKFLLTLLDCGMDVGEACKRHKIPYEQGHARWLRARDAARKLLAKGEWEPEDVLLEVEI